MKKILVMAGGTGGHIFPALAVAGFLRSHGCDVLWLGTENGMEAKLVPAAGFPIEYLKFSGVRRSGLIRWLAMPFLLFFALLKSAALIFRHRPDMVLGMGGFASFPGGLAAALLGKPLLIHEQNSVAGLSNRILSHLANKVVTGFPSVLGKKAILAGNPVRPEIEALPAPDERFAGRSGPLKLLVVGGSRGARALNDALPAALAAQPEKFSVVHQSGEADFERTKEAYRQAGVTAEVLPFIGDMAENYAGCDLIVCRSGALTIAEISAAGVASILVPYPHAVDDHQTGNARYLSETGAAILLPQNELPAKLGQALAGLDREKLLVMAKKARAAALPAATEKVAKLCLTLAEGREER